MQNVVIKHLRKNGNFVDLCFSDGEKRTLVDPLFELWSIRRSHKGVGEYSTLSISLKAYYMQSDYHKLFLKSSRDIVMNSDSKPNLAMVDTIAGKGYQMKERKEKSIHP